MNSTPISILYTQDADLVRKARAFLRTSAQVRHVADPDRLEPVLQQTGPAVLMMDLRAKECRELIDQVHNDQPDVLIIALGVKQSEPLLEAEQLGIYAAEELDLDRRRFQALLGRAFDYQRVMQENREFRETSTMTTQRSPRDEPARSKSDPGRALPILRLPRVLGRPHDMDTVVASIVEGVGEAAGVSRVGLFSRTRKGEPYRFRSGIRCLPETDQLQFGERDALVRWFELNAHLISRPFTRMAASSDGSFLGIA